MAELAVSPAGLPQETAEVAAPAWSAPSAILLLPRGTARASARWVILIAAALSVFGLVMLTTVSTGPETPASDPYRFVRRQAMSLAGAAALGIICSRLDYRMLARRSWWLLGALWVLLLVALLMPQQLGSHRWIPIGDMGQLQPSEFTKLALILWTAAFADRAGERLGRFWAGFAPGIGVVGLTSALVIVEPDNGTALFLAAIGGTVLLVNGLRLKHIVPLLLAGVPAVLLGISSLHKYVDGRMKSFQGGFADKIGQIQQALIAIGSGEVFGLGLGCGRAQLGRVPKIYNDFMLAAVGQQLGFAGAVLVVIAFVFLFLHGLRIASHAADQLGFSIAFGVSFMIALQAAINIAVATDTVPPKGINLPFLSCGGSSVLCLGAALGLLHSVARRAGQRAGAEA
jgi:cell division protein FtsW